MKFKSALVTQVSGSVGGMTGSHNKGGMYFRARSIPVDPATSFQLAMRNAQTLVASRWNAILTQLQRDAWAVYASNVPIIDSLGDPRNISGMAMYSRSNTIRLQAGLVAIDDGPTDFTLPSFTAPTVGNYAAVTEQFDVSYTNTDAWAGEVGGGLLIYGSRPQNPGINFFKGPYRFATMVAGAVVAPTSPETVTNPFPFVDGNKLFQQFRVVRADGRLSGKFRLSGISA